MYVIDVIPLERKVSSQSLSYFCKSKIPKWSIVRVPIKKSSTLALVTKSRSVAEDKVNIKKAKYSLVAIKSGNVSSLPDSMISTFEIIYSELFKSYYDIISNFVPKHFFTILEIHNAQDQKLPVKIPNKPELVEREDAERIMIYRKKIREEFAKNRSVVVVLPTVKHVIKYGADLSKGLEQRSFFLHGSLNKIQQTKTMSRLYSEKTPVCFICTPKFAFLPIFNPGVLIIENEHFQGYEQYYPPGIDYRQALLFHARSQKMDVVIGDKVARIEIRGRLLTGEILAEMPKRRSLPINRDSLIIEKIDKSTKSLFNKSVSRAINENINRGADVLIVAPYKGYALSIICRDCSTIVLCKKCKMPVSLSKTDSGYFFNCSHCGFSSPAKNMCINCNSWNTMAMGFGIERISEALAENFKEVELQTLSDDVNDKIVKNDTPENTGGKIILCSPRAIHKITSSPTLAVIVNADVLLSFPHFTSYESFFYLITELQSIVDGIIHVQSKRDITDFEEILFPPSHRDFIDRELGFRKIAEYPPSHNVYIITGDDDNKIEILARKTEELGVSNYTIKARSKGYIDIVIHVGRHSDNINIKDFLSLARDSGAIVRKNSEVYVPGISRISKLRSK